MDFLEKNAFCQYVRGTVEDCGEEAIYLYLPTEGGYIQYSLIHSVVPAKQCDVWRMGPVFYCDTSMARQIRLTREGAEWEMALRLQDRPDFIGGVAHGDEIGTDLVCYVDDKVCRMDALCQPTPFATLTVCINSIGYDPAAPSEAVLRHSKRIVVNSAQIRVIQRVEWICDVILAQSYMAMMPPLKCVTDSYRTEKGEYCSIPERSLRESGDFSALSLRGESGFVFSLQIPRYLTEQGKNTFLITDNGGNTYHKMYFVLAHGGHASQGNVWETETVYRIDKGDPAERNFAL